MDSLQMFIEIEDIAGEKEKNALTLEWEDVNGRI